LKQFCLILKIVFTTGGNANGKPCRFPFKYNGIDHNQCTFEDAQNFNNKKWCRTNDDTATTLEWGNCPCKIIILNIFPIL
jgi:matrix metalloproteinase-2 (gelatinase A)